ncbi:MAG: sodium/proline symporter [Lachnospiraceae bacterium]|nr:sodium/proline symporter [Lachnospiraceae bacterium]
MNGYELAAFIVYFALVIGVGVFFFMKSRKNGGEKEYFLGGRNMSGPVAALSAGASDMSAWVLMGLPGAIYALGLGQLWISIGLAIGTVLAWIFVAPRLRTFSMKANDSITIPQFLTNRFKSKNKILQVVCAVVFIVAYTVYAASSISACGNLFTTVFHIENPLLPMIIAAAIIIIYTFLGGFNAVCWTDFFQGLLMLAALMAAPIVGMFAIKAEGFVPMSEVNMGENYFNILSSGSFDKASLIDILSGIAWGFGYFGMPHILIRYMSIRSKKEMKRSRVIGSAWTILILAATSVVAIVGRKYIGDALLVVMEDGGDRRSEIFIELVRSLFPALLSGILLSAILAASMSTADSQLLASSSAFASDVYKPIFRKNASDKEMLWAGRFVVILIAIAALLIAINPNSGGIMDLVSNAWGFFGAAFGPTIILSLYWKRFNYIGAVAGIITGFTVDVLWLFVVPNEAFGGFGGVYELFPGFIIGFLVCVIVTLVTKAPSKEVQQLFDDAVAFTKNEE